MNRLLFVVLFCLFGCSAFHGTASAQPFAGAIVIPTPGNPATVTAADFNRDGHQDIIYQDAYTGGQLHLLLNNGDGTFRDTQQISLPLDIGGSLTVADLNGDGLPDLIVGYYPSTLNFVPIRFAVLLNQGDGTLGPPIFSSFVPAGYPAPATLRLAVADFDGDGHVDFVFMSGTGDVFLALGDGAGHFTPQRLFISAAYSDVFVGDFNEDGKPDIAIRNVGGIDIALNTGSGTFGPLHTQAAVSDLGPSRPFYVADVDKDGHLDLIYGTYNYLYIAKGHGDGTFSAPVLRGSLSASVIAVNDTNGDGLVDILTSDAVGAVVMLQDKAGNFSYPSLSGPAIGDLFAFSAVAADFYGDGHLSLVTSATGALVLSRGLGDGTLAGANATLTRYGPATTLQAEDLNGDGHIDVSTFEGNGSYYGSVATYLGDGDGHFEARGYVYADQTYSGQSGVADFSSHGVPDLFNAGHDLQNDGTGLLTPGPQLVNLLPGFRSVGFTTTADFNEDGHPDPATTSVPIAGGGGGSIAVGLSTGPGTYTTIQIPTPYRPGPIVSKDFNHDGHVDLAVASASQVFIYTGNGKGDFNLSQTLEVGYTVNSAFTSDTLTDLEAADLDGDGNIDLLVPTADKNVIQIFYGRPDGTFDPAISLATDQDVRFVTVADLDRDGKPDLILGGHALVRVLHGLGARAFQSPAVMLAGNPFPQKIVVADVNNDGNPDLLVPNGSCTAYEAGQSFTVLLNLLPRVDSHSLSATLACTPEPSPLGQTFTCTATFRPLANSALPAGTIAFQLDGNPVGTAALKNLTAALSFPGSLAVGRHQLSAGFAGDSNFAATSATGIHTVAFATPAIVLSGPAHSSFGQSITFQTAVSGSGGPATGSTVFLEQSSVLATVALSNGSSSFSTSGLSAGVHLLHAAYSGDSQYSSGNSNTVSITVDAPPTQTQLVASPTTAILKQTVTLQATVTSTAGPVSGNVVFFDGASQLATVPVGTNGVASLDNSTLSLGLHSITAQFTGNDSFSASTSAPVSVTILGVPTTTLISSSINPSYPTRSIVFTATVLTSNSLYPPIGTVRFADGATPLGDAVIGAGGVATLTTANLAIGLHPITASFLGGGQLVPSTSLILQQSVLANDFSISPTSSQITLQTQHHGKIALTLTALGGFDEDISLRCDNAPTHASCIFTPGAATVNSSTSPKAVSLWVDTSDVIGYARNTRPSPLDRHPDLLLAALFFPIFGFAGRLAFGRQSRLRIVILAAVFAPVAGMLGCTGKIPASVTPGTYTILVTGTSSRSAIAHTATLQLTVTP